MLLKIEGAESRILWYEVRETEVALSNEVAILFNFRDYSDVVEARHALQAKELDIAMRTHDLKTPLQGIIGMLDQIDRRVRSSLPYRVIKGSAELMLNLVNGMLDLSSMLSGRFEKRTSAVNLRELIVETASMVKSFYRHANKI